MNGEIAIGIDSSNKQCCNKRYSESGQNTAEYFYAVSDDGYKYSNDVEHAQEFLELANPVPVNNDIIKIELNVKDKTLSFYHNGSYKGIVFDNICFLNVEYFMAVYIGNQESKVQLTDFQQLYLK